MVLCSPARGSVHDHADLALQHISPLPQMAGKMPVDGQPSQRGSFTNLHNRSLRPRAQRVHPLAIGEAAKGMVYSEG